MLEESGTMNDMTERILVPGCFSIHDGFLAPTQELAMSVALAEETKKHLKSQFTYAFGWPPRIDKGHKMARYGDAGVKYSYKDTEKPMHGWTPTLQRLKNMVESFVGEAFNCGVINTYEPNSSLYPHADSKYIPQLDKEPTIVGVSFGATRTMQLYPYDGKKRGDALYVPLEPGSLIVMRGRSQTDWHHGIAAQPSSKGTRLSVTFRRHVR